MKLLTCLMLTFLIGCNQTAQRLISNRTDVPSSITLTSPAFADGHPIPTKYATSLDLSPPLKWSNIPSGAKSLVLIMEDADVPPPEPFIHWIVFNIPTTMTEFSEAMPHDRKPKAFPEVVQGRNSRKKTGYTHPAPYDHRTHHYHFEIYALDDVIDPETAHDKPEIITAMSGHVLAKGEMIGTYQE